MAAAKPTVLDLTREELVAAAAEHRLARPAAERLFKALHREGATTFEGAKGLEERFSIDPLVPVTQRTSADGSTDKVLFRLPDGELIETVMMRYEEDEHRHRRRTVCVSTQAGCAMGCTFCATGQQGFRRHLSAGEIVAQVVWMARIARREDAEVTNVVYMGMGEPFANYDRTMKSIAILNDGRGLHIGSRHITVSTVGLVPEIIRFARKPLATHLAVSLHAPDDATRAAILPINRRYPLAELLDACRSYIEETGRRVFFEYVLMAGSNDSPGQAHALGTLLGGMNCHVNLIPVNPTDDGPYGRPSEAQSAGFQVILREHGVPSTVRTEKGIDIAAGCGQLRARAIS
ncbi:MAG: 23S rRNA (adenine(2503)-C(2))-methyltransferase RlmN [Planctomycetes bacterium]|nr:23S rRNA (adenine(2503)-C(2))-methyltransferase RlmN [Planctomycetota bacterium]